MSKPRRGEVGCVWALFIGLLALSAFIIFSELARSWVWIKWAFE